MMMPAPKYRRWLRRERGQAMILLITFLVFLTAFLVSKGLTRTSTQVAVERDKRTMEVLQEAKLTLINWAASEVLHTTFQPGALPCPDRKLPSDVNTGFQEASCTTAATRIGRFPWRTVGASDLRDGNGDQLWYVLSANYRQAPGTTVINSDTQGTITITGATPASNVIAVIFSPGTAFQSQTRNPTNLANWTNQSNFLDGANAGANNDNFETRVPPNDRDASGTITFNDKLITITNADLFDMVEPAVASMLSKSLQGGSTVNSYINVYRTTWGRYPFAAAFANPGTSVFKGTVGAVAGLLPLTTDSTFITWKTSAPAPAIAAAPGNPGTVDVSTGYTNCSNSSATQLECKANWCGTSPNLATVQITATGNNVGLAFVRSFIDLDLTVDRSSGGLNSNWTSASGTVMPTSSYAVAADGTGTVSLIIQLPTRACGSIRTARIRIPVPPFDSITNAGDAWTGWFIANQWYKQVYYVASSSWVPGGNGACTPVPVVSNQCLTVNNWPTSPANNKGALLILAGRSLNGSARPSPTLSDYLEGENILNEIYGVGPSPANFVYETLVGRPGAKNDRLAVLYP